MNVVKFERRQANLEAIGPWLQEQACAQYGADPEPLVEGPRSLEGDNSSNRWWRIELGANQLLFVGATDKVLRGREFSWIRDVLKGHKFLERAKAASAEAPRSGVLLLSDGKLEQRPISD